MTTRSHEAASTKVLGDNDFADGLKDKANVGGVGCTRDVDEHRAVGVLVQLGKLDLDELNGRLKLIATCAGTRGEK